MRLATALCCCLSLFITYMIWPHDNNASTANVPWSRTEFVNTVLKEKATYMTSDPSCSDCEIYNMKSDISMLHFNCFQTNVKPVTNICPFPSKEDVFISILLNNKGSWENKRVSELTTWLAENPTYGFIDIGANIGTYTLPIAALGNDVVAVDAVFEHAARIHKAASLSKTTDHITMLVNAVSDHRGIADVIKTKDHNPGGTHVQNVKLSANANYSNDNYVKSIVMDDLLPLCKFKNAVMKIDVEGFEHRAFYEADKLFDRINIEYVQMEWMIVKRYSDSNAWPSDNVYFKLMVDLFIKKHYVPKDSLHGQLLNLGDMNNWPMDIVWVKEKTPQIDVKTTNYVGMSWNRTEFVTNVLEKKATYMTSDPSCSDCEVYNMKSDIGMLHFNCFQANVKPVTNICPFPSEEDVFISIALNQNGSWENHRVSELTTWLADNPTCGFIDIGANIGTYTLPIAALGNDVVAVDAVFEHAARIHKAASLSKTTDHITMLVNAVSDHHGIADVIKTTDQNPGGTHVQNVKWDSKRNYSDDNYVKSIVMDDLLPLCKFKNAVMKIDVEGFEHRAFYEADKLFDSINIEYVQMEWMIVKRYFDIYAWPNDNMYFKLMVDLFIRKHYVPKDSFHGQLLNLGDMNNWPMDIVWAKEKTPQIDVKTTNSVGMSWNRTEFVTNVLEKKATYMTSDPSCSDCEIYNMKSDISMLHFNCFQTNVKPVTNICPFPSKEDVFISIVLNNKGSWENKRVSELTTWLADNPTFGFIDIGANIGTYTLPIAALANDVVAVDAVFEHAARIHKAASLSKTTDHITMLVNAVSDHRGIADVIKNTKGNPGGTQVKNVKLDPNANYSNDSYINSIVMDDLLPLCKFKNAVMKIDVEGFEHRAFYEADKLFDNINIEYVQMEWMIVKRYSDSNAWPSDNVYYKHMVELFKKKHYAPKDSLHGQLLNLGDMNNWPIDIVWVKEKTPQNNVKTTKSGGMSWNRTEFVTNVLEKKATYMTSDPSCSDCEIYNMKSDISMLHFNCFQTNVKPVTNICPFPSEEDVFISILLNNKGSWENKRVSELTTWLADNPTYGFIDIGANIGTYTLPIAALGSDVVAVDAVFEHAARIHKAASLSKTTDHITMLVNAVSDHHGIADVIKTTDQNPGGTHVQNVKWDSKRNYSDDNYVKSIVMDDLLPLCKFKNAVMKIDVEGFEHRAFYEADKLFDSINIEYVQMEWMIVKRYSDSNAWPSDNVYYKHMVDLFKNKYYTPKDAFNGKLLNLGDMNNWPMDIVWVKEKTPQIDVKTTKSSGMS